MADHFAARTGRSYTYEFHFSCPRCGITYARSYDSGGGLCRDCKAVLTKTERAAWSGTPKEALS